MIEQMIEPIALALGCLWLGYKAYKTKNERQFLSALIILAILPSRWPFFLPAKLSFGLIALTAAGFLIYDRLYKYKKDNILFLYAFILTIFGFLFLAEAFLYKKGPS